MSTAALPFTKEQTRLLIASPDPAFRKMFTGVVVDPAGRVEEVSTGAQALSKLESAPFDVLVLDRYLPDLNSQEIADLARNRFAPIEVRVIDSRTGADKAFVESSAWSLPHPRRRYRSPRVLLTRNRCREW